MKFKSLLYAVSAACAILLSAGSAVAAEIQNVDPPFWWAGMKNPELQILVHGKNISEAEVSITYPGVSIKRVDKVSNPNYLFIYLDITSQAKPGTFDIVFTEKGKRKPTIHKYELRERNQKTGALGFNTEDVLYLITPDRFANGNPANDNLPDVPSVLTAQKIAAQNAPARQNQQQGQRAQQGQRPQGQQAQRPQQGQRPQGAPQGNWNGQRQQMPQPQGRSANGRHGGDIRGVIDHLDYIQDLGVTTIWLNPVQSNSVRSYHGYAINDFYEIDPRFGTMEEYIEFVDAAHARGMKVVMDMIFNHCGGDHWWMNDLPTEDWLNFDNTFTNCNHLKWTVMDPHAAPSELKGFTDGWFNSGMPDLNQRNYHVATYLIQQSMWWIEHTRIDGIRQDTYSYMDFDFGARWCRETFEEYPDFNITGEVWYPLGASFPAWWQRNQSLSEKNSELKTVMDFNLAFISQTAFDEPSASKEQFSTGLFNIYMSMANDFLYPDPDNILVFLDNHDLSRFREADDEGLNKYKQGIAFLLTTRGIPQIYYGTELLFEGSKAQGDGTIRKDMPGGWAGDERSVFTREGRTAEENEAYDYMKTLLHWRSTSDAVKHGKLIQYAPVPGYGDCYVYARILEDKTVLVVLNGSDKDANMKMDRYSDVVTGYTKGKDVVTGEVLDITTSIKVPARGTYVLDLIK